MSQLSTFDQWTLDEARKALEASQGERDALPTRVTSERWKST